MKFKVGDKIRCIDSGIYTGSKNDLELQQIYVISDISTPIRCDRDHKEIKVIGNPYYWLPTRFELVEEEKEIDYLAINKDICSV